MVKMKLNGNQIKTIEEEYQTSLYPKRGICLAKGKGIYVFDINGKKYIDCMTNIGVNILGYKEAHVLKPILKQISTLPSCHQSFYSRERAILLNEIIAISPKPLSKVIFTGSGAECIEAAIKLARVKSGKHTFIAMTNGYHGKTFGALSATGQEKYRQPFMPLLPEFVHVPFNNYEALEHIIDSKTAGVILEPILGEGGVIPADKTYLKRVRALCRRRNALFILDEVQTAIRTGSWFAFEQFAVTPDIVCVAKSFSYGLPFGFVLTTDEISRSMPKGGHGSTFAGNPVACVAATAVIKRIKEGEYLSNAKTVGAYFKKRLQTIKHPAIKEVRGMGLMIGMELLENVTPYVKKMQDFGLLTIPTAHNTIRFLPPITFTEQNADDVVEILLAVFKKST